MKKETPAEMLIRVRKAQERIQRQVNTKQKMKKANQPYIEPKKGEIIQDEFSAPTNSTGPAVPGTGDDSSTVVVKKKKRYVYCGPGSRKRWMV